MKKVFTLVGWLMLIGTTTIFLTGCDKTVRYSVDPDVLQKIYSATNKATPRILNSTDIFIDYSTCVKEAVVKSDFFEAIRPSLVGIKPVVLYAIKGPDIKMISSDMDTISQELNKIAEISYANIHAAVEQICRSNHQAVLITDGEYWTQPQGERINLPYMKESFSYWLNRGMSIYIITEPYGEPYNGKTYDKKRFYMFFTDDKLPNNIYEQVSRADGFRSTKVSFYKLTNSDTKIIRSKDIVDDNLQFRVDTVSGFDFITIDNSWEDIIKWVKNATDDSGNPIPNGKPLIKNIKIKTKTLENFYIEDIDLRISNISEVYLDSAHLIKHSKNIPEGFILDKESFKKEGLIVIKMTDKFIDYLFSKNQMENLIRMDILFKKVTQKPLDKANLIWQSMSKPGNENVSIYESIKQTLDDPNINPIKQNNGIIHTIFIKTAEYK